MEETVGGNPRDLAADTAAPDESGFQDPGAESDGELDTDRPLTGRGCPDCGFAGGQCMMGVDDCGIAAARRKAAAAPRPVPGSPMVTSGPVNIVQQDQGGVWVTYHHDRSMVAIHRSELEALRHAVLESASVRLVLWGEEL